MKNERTQAERRKQQRAVRGLKENWGWVPPTENSRDVDIENEALEKKYQEWVDDYIAGNIRFKRYPKNVEHDEADMTGRSLHEALTELGISEEVRSKIIERADGLYQVSIPALQLPQEIANGYAYKGGMARDVLRYGLGMIPKEKINPRDIDIVRLKPEPSYEGEDDEMIKKFGADSHLEILGVEDISDGKMTAYFRRRDFTMNEVLLTKDGVFCTRSCVLDTLRGIIRLTKFEQERFRSISSKMLAKMLRLHVETGASMKGIDPWAYEEAVEHSAMSPFWMAVHLDRAYGRSEDLAMKYIAALKERHCLPDDLHTLNDVCRYLLDQIYADRKNSSYRFYAIPENFWNNLPKPKEEYLDDKDVLSAQQMERIKK